MVESLQNDYFTQHSPPAGMGSVNLCPEVQPTSTQPTPQSFAEPPQHSVPNFAEQVTQQVAGQMARTATTQVASLLRKGAGEVRVYIERNHYSVHALSLCGGGALAVVSGLGLLNVFASLTGPLNYLLHGYQLAFGIVLCVIDGPQDKWPRAQAAVVQYIPFLHNNAGRSLFYLFVACLEASQDAYIHQAVGWYFFVIALMHIALKCKSSGQGETEGDEKSQELLQAPSSTASYAAPNDVSYAPFA